MFLLIEEILLNKHKIVNIEDAVNLPKINIDEVYYTKLINGVKIKSTSITDVSGEFLLYCKNELFGISLIENGFIKIKTNLKEKYYD